MNVSVPELSKTQEEAIYQKRKKENREEIRKKVWKVLKYGGLGALTGVTAGAALGLAGTATVAGLAPSLASTIPAMGTTFTGGGALLGGTIGVSSGVSKAYYKSKQDLEIQKLSEAFDEKLKEELEKTRIYQEKLEENIRQSETYKQQLQKIEKENKELKKSLTEVTQKIEILLKNEEEEEEEEEERKE